MKIVDVGTIYVLANRDQSLAKVGMTRNGTPDTRADDYSRQHGFQWFTYWHAHIQNVAAVEAAAHQALANRRFSLIPEAREVFHCTPEVALRVVEPLIITPGGDAPTEATLHQFAYLDLLVALAKTELRQLLYRHRYGRHLMAAWSVLSRLRR
jgi:hypothetical protein